jgi:hypothetical protein
MVVPCFLPHLGDVELEDTGDNAPSIQLEIAQMAARHRSQTAVWWCSRIEGRSVKCRSRQMIALFDVLSENVLQ